MGQFEPCMCGADDCRYCRPWIAYEDLGDDTEPEFDDYEMEVYA